MEVKVNGGIDTLDQFSIPIDHHTIAIKSFWGILTSCILKFDLNNSFLEVKSLSEIFIHRDI